jgi:hypothetical protein
MHLIKLTRIRAEGELHVNPDHVVMVQDVIDHDGKRKPYAKVTLVTGWTGEVLETVKHPAWVSYLSHDAEPALPWRYRLAPNGRDVLDYGSEGTRDNGAEFGL